MPSEKHYEMLWDCPRCETPKLLGLSHRNCPNCGSPQDATKRYFPKDEDKVAVEDHPFVGADKQCAGCDAPNAATAQFCVGCGSPMDGSAAVKQRETQSDVAGGFAEDSSKAATAEEQARKLAARAAAQDPQPKPASKAPWLLGAGGLLAMGALVVCVGIIGLMMWKKEAAVTLNAHTWSREIAVEQFKAVTDSAWKEAVPAGSRNVSCSQAQRSTTKVPDGQECHTERTDNGDGTFKEAEKCATKYREDPVYDQKCSYTVDRWATVRTDRAGGNGLSPAPSWPPVTAGGSERSGAKSEKYTLSFTDDGGRVLTCDLPQDRWAAYADGTRYTAPVGMVSASIDCNALKPVK